MKWLRPAALAALLLMGCSSGPPSSEPGPQAQGCGKGESLSDDGRCLDAFNRYQPAERVDFDNVVAYGDPLTRLSLPEPPKSGFRIVVPPRTLEPGAEKTDCVAWPYPQIKNKYVYAARIYTSAGLHHSNMYGVLKNAALGDSPYPDCNPGQSDLQVGNILAGDIPDVLFANSTQIRGSEGIVFGPGMAYHVATEGREIATSIHYLNSGVDPLLVEIVYDFFTMPKELVETELVPFLFDNYAFQVEPHSIEDVVTQCYVYGGNIVSMMGHSHERTSEFAVDLLSEDGSEERVYTASGSSLDSDIRVFDTPISLDGISQIRHRCTIENELDTPIHYGIGNNEMCTLFGYMYPPASQTLGAVQNGDACLSLQIGGQRP